MNIKKTHTNAFANLIASLLFLAGGVWAWGKTYGFKEVRNTFVQPSAFPRIMCAGMLIFAAALLIQSVLALLTMDKAAPDSALMEGPLPKAAPGLNVVRDKGLQGALITMVLSIIYTFLFKPLGYVLDSFLLSMAIMYLIGKRKPLQMILVSALVPLAMFIIFYMVLKVNIPMGPLQFIRDFLDRL